VSGSSGGNGPVRHHPGEATLAGYVAGRLGKLPGVVVATHLSHCAECRAVARAAEAVGGLLLEEVSATPLAAGSRDRTLARLDDGPQAAEDPPTLDGLAAKEFRWLAPGIRFAELRRSEDELLGLLRLRPGVAVALHTHRGSELTCVLEGAYRDGASVYRRGDFEEVDQLVRHRPVAEGPGDCLCLVATRGRVRFATVLSRLWQPFQPF